MLTQQAKQTLIKQQYRIVGDHSAVKTCHWTKNMIKGKGGCYKLVFYGIMSNQCMQMTSSISCANRCTFCWRDYKAPVAKEWKWKVDDPSEILKGSLHYHKDLLYGLKGFEGTNMAAYNASNTVKHVALSLTGEPITYPRMNELIDLFHEQEISTFLVTNAQYPEHIKQLKPITQLYVSLDAPNKQLLKEVDVPLFSDYWERLQQSLEYLAKKPERTCIRLTAVKGINMVEPENYATLITKGDPDFIEIKAYMHIGASRLRLSRTNMPTHEEVVIFAKQIMEYLPDYELVTEHIPSRVVMAAKKIFKKNGKWHTWIDFATFFKLLKLNKTFSSLDYIKRTPKVGFEKNKTAVDELDVMAGV